MARELTSIALRLRQASVLQPFAVRRPLGSFVMKKPLPLSPHLLSYRWSWTMGYSVLHRLSGLWLVVFSWVFVVWLGALAWSPEFFAALQGFLGSFWGQALLFLWLGAVFYHLFNGLRHLLWDSGRGLSLGWARFLGHGMMVLVVVATGLVWVWSAWL